MEIWARRRTVSRGQRTRRSRAEREKVPRLHAEGLRMGSILSWFLSRSGAEVDIKEGMVEVRNVMGRRCDGMMYDGEGRVLIVARRERGAREAGVRIRRVRAVSMGESRRVEMSVPVTEIKTLATGAVEVKIDVLGGAARGVGVDISDSAIPRTPARRDRRKVSRARCRIE